jgi:DNA (cytosine-5)-methyltransferase 1
VSRPVCVDLFCGAGGLSEGLFQAGFRVIAGFDRDPDMLAIYASRFARRSTKAIRFNLERASGADVMREAGLRRAPALVCGGPPCQGFSNHRRGTGPDRRNRLVASFVRIALEIRPRTILLENVAGLTYAPHRRTLHGVLRRIAAAGYQVELKVIDASDYGLPQTRKRLFIVARRGKRRFDWPRRGSRRTTVADAIADLPRVLAGADDGTVPYRRRSPSAYQRRLRRGSNGAANHQPADLSRRNLTRIRHLARGDDWRQLPRRLLTAGMRRASKNSHTTRFGRLRWSQQAGTILTRFDDPKNGAYIHPEEHRTLTAREAARLQGFPDSFRFMGSRGVQGTAIGNAVPPVLARLVGLRLVAWLGRGKHER